MSARREARALEAAFSPVGAAEERIADAALLAMHRLRDRLVHSNRNTAACKVDEAMGALEDACRMVWPRTGRIAA